MQYIIHQDESSICRNATNKNKKSENVKNVFVLFSIRRFILLKIQMKLTNNFLSLYHLFLIQNVRCVWHYQNWLCQKVCWTLKFRQYHLLSYLFCIISRKISFIKDIFVSLVIHLAWWCHRSKNCLNVHINLRFQRLD